MLILHYRILNHNNQGTQQVISLLMKMAEFFFFQNMSLSVFFMHEDSTVLHSKAKIRQDYCHNTLYIWRPEMKKNRTTKEKDFRLNTGSWNRGESGAGLQVK